jgi:threonine dehydratase
MAASIEAGHIVTVDARPSLSDGTAGSVEPGAITFDLVRELVAEWALVDEEAIRDALRMEHLGRDLGHRTGGLRLGHESRCA